MGQPITTRDALRAAIDALPPVAPGCVRVWRGQTHDHAQMLPSGLRRPIRNRVIWQVYCQHLHLDMVPEAIGAGGEMTIETLMVAGLWLKAVAQHYGPGSDFLDVTHSVDAALWFALNRYREVPTEGLIGPDGPPDPLRDHPTLSVMATYDAWEEPAYLYAFDLPAWDGESIAQAGTVIDIARAPAVFANCPRMRAQSGCLVYCRQADGTPLDLRERRVAGTPLAVQRPMTGSPAPGWSLPRLFPSPAEDAWYARLLSVPMNYAPEPSPPRLQRAIPVVPYLDEHDDAYTRAVVWRDVALAAPLVHRFLPMFVEPDDPADRPVAIVLEAPMVFPHPPGDSLEWHHGLLSQDLPDDCVVYAPGGTEPAGRVSLKRVLFEFSALEQTGWERVVDRQERFESVLRALFLQRVGDAWSVHFLRQTLPTGPLQEPEGFLMRYDAARARWVFFAPGQEAVLPLNDAGWLAKPVLVALMLLRHLNPVLKHHALGRLATGAGDGRRRMLLDAARDAARLVRVPSPVCDWHVLRDARSPEEPFTSLGDPVALTELTFSGAFADVPLEQLRVQQA